MLKRGIKSKILKFKLSEICYFPELLTGVLNFPSLYPKHEMSIYKMEIVEFRRYCRNGIIDNYRN